MSKFEVSVVSAHLDIRQLAAQLNERADHFEIGQLQQLRANIRGHTKRLSSAIFTKQTIHDNWAFHYGGRKELQFNIGIESDGEQPLLRWGVAFSFQLSQSLPNLDVLIPKVRLFNEHISSSADRLADMRMWHHLKGQRSVDSMPSPIPYELVQPGAFVFLGKRARSVPSIDSILEDFDRLLPSYIFTEGGGRMSVGTAPHEFKFLPKHCVRHSATVASFEQRQLDVNLRHNVLQEKLTRLLIEKHGAENVANEQSTGRGTLIDIAVRLENGSFVFYEIKTALSAAACIRQALGQVLEYSFWPEAQEPVKIVVCGEAAIDRESADYLSRLNSRFGLPIFYEQVCCD